MKKIFTLILVLTAALSYSQSTTLVISQLYGSGGNTGANFNADFVELHNISTSAQSLAGLTIQYSSSANIGAWTGVSPLPATSIPAGGYYLIQMSTIGAVGAALPTPDNLANPTIAMSGTNGKIALVNGLTALTACPVPSAGVIDMVGYGSANCFETAPTAVLSATTGAIRNNNGCAETDNNGADFTVTIPVPRNSATAAVICTGGPATPSLIAGTVANFGNVTVSTNSVSQSFNLSGSNLTGAPGTITITAPSTDFQVSNNNSTWGASTTIPYTSASLTSTPVYVRFTPQTVGPKSGNVNIFGGGVSSVNVAVSGNGVAPAGPTVTVTSGPLNFGSVCLNTIGGPTAVSLSGANLTAADLVVNALNGYTYSTNFGGPFTATLTLTHAAGSFSPDIFVQFTPTAAISYSGNITVSGGGQTTASNIPVTASGTAGTATVETGSASSIMQTSATVNGTIPAQGCSPVTAYGFEFSTTSGFINGTVAIASNLAGGNFSASLSPLLPSTTYYYKAYATNAGGTAYGMEMSFITSSPPPASLSATALADFGANCVGTAVGPNSFDITGVDLNSTAITVGPLNGFTFSATSGGTYTSILTLTQPGGAYNQTVFVKFNAPSIGTFNGNIPVIGGGVSTFSVPVMALGSNTVATLVTGTASAITANSVVASGNVASLGCSAVFSYGIEYSGISGFINGTGMRVPSNNLTGTDFSSQLNGLVQNTTYYFKAYAENNGGISYGDQNSFTTAAIPDGLVIYGNPVIRGQNLRFSLKGIKPGHYSARIHNGIGQLVYQKEFITQVNFLDNSFQFPSFLPIGIYNLEIVNYEYKIQKSFFAQ